MSEILIADLLAEAAKVEKQFKDNLSIVEKRDDLSSKGLADARAMFAQNYRKAVADLQERARAILEAERVKLKRERAAGRAKEVETERATLGDLVYAQLRARELEAMSSADIRREYDEAPEGFDKTLVGRLGRIILFERVNREPTEANFLALQGFNTSPAYVVALEGRERDLRRSEELVGELDPVGWKAEFGATMGIDPAFVQTTTQFGATVAQGDKA